MAQRVQAREETIEKHGSVSIEDHLFSERTGRTRTKSHACSDALQRFHHRTLSGSHRTWGQTHSRLEQRRNRPGTSGAAGTSPKTHCLLERPTMESLVRVLSMLPHVQSPEVKQSSFSEWTSLGLCRLEGLTARAQGRHVSCRTLSFEPTPSCRRLAAASKAQGPNPGKVHHSDAGAQSRKPVLPPCLCAIVPVVAQWAPTPVTLRWRFGLFRFASRRHLRTSALRVVSLFR